MGVDFDYFAEAGFTPFRLQPESKVSYFCPGAKDSNFALSSVPNQDLTVELWVCFKLGRFPDFLNYAMTGTKAPSAILRIDYSLKSTHEVKIAVAGLRIPMMSISHSDLMPIRSERSDAGSLSVK